MFVYICFMVWIYFVRVKMKRISVQRGWNCAGIGNIGLAVPSSRATTFLQIPAYCKFHRDCYNRFSNVQMLSREEKRQEGREMLRQVKSSLSIILNWVNVEWDSGICVSWNSVFGVRNVNMHKYLITPLVKILTRSKCCLSQFKWINFDLRYWLLTQLNLDKTVVNV